jgi:hypothetical protein
VSKERGDLREKKVTLDNKDNKAFQGEGREGRQCDSGTVDVSLTFLEVTDAVNSIVTCNDV